MKRKMKRLTLSRETVRALNPEEMTAAQGGASFYQVTAYVICATHTCPSECGQWYCQGV
jgi:hypothetical protein